MATSPVWFITGASAGLGASIAIAALKAGNRVIATARNPAKAARDVSQVEALGGKWLQLDVTASDVREKVEQAVKEYGKLDVVINNAGYSLLGAMEDMSEEEIHTQFNTNVYGPIRVMKAVLPSMRANRSGTIVNITSIAGLDALSASSMYAGTKFALEGISESLAKELAPFNIRVLLVEPGAFRTQFLTARVKPAAGLTEEYKDTPVDTVLKNMDAMNGKQPGDPDKAATRIIEMINGTGMAEGKTGLLRLLLGPDCLRRAKAKTIGLLENLDAMEEIALSTNYDN
ncbi:hypothetical protein AJ80_03803 [Polytolypa hystricis UAMH7299]|uniref:Short chain oxidoreductase/dehydrogenase n=1 Tax=Polytolypa hystricis (strain UAMH7299) TaxID=1447883 RepID=A0A2B7YFG1_POLH7|nr:hypothetical protein AJ80_03803 [Polytolypa hystricis UAMH7299]